MNEYVRSIQAEGLYNRFDIPRTEFTSGVNILHGKNGAGKTTLLHVLANVLNGDYRRFAFLIFKSLSIELSEGRTIRVASSNDQEETVVVYINDSEIGRYRIKEIQESKSRRPIPAEVSRLARERYLEECEAEEAAENKPNLGTAYFPAFRTMIEAWSSLREDRYSYSRASPSQSMRWRNLATRRAREWFGEFVPSVNFPSLIEIQEQIALQVDEARSKVWRADRSLLTKAFLDTFRALSKDDESQHENVSVILEDIGKLFDRLKATPLKAESMILTGIYDELRAYLLKFRIGEEAELTAIRVLKVYRQMLNGIADIQETSFAGIQLYLASVNEFLEGKSLAVNTDMPGRRGDAIAIRFADQTKLEGLRALSSGERQIVTLIYASTHMSEQKVVLIDEPEISLHIDWQTKLLSKMSEQLGSRQIIACTHSPVIGENYEGRLQKLALVKSKTIDQLHTEDPDDEVDTP